jgi:magnesium-transporting ATPase (P-type)
MVEENKNNTGTVTEIQNRLQLIITIAIFFSAVVYNFFNIYDKTKSDSVALSYGILVVFYLLAYFLFEIRKNKIVANRLKIINVLMLVGVVMFSIPILYMTSVGRLHNSLILLVLSLVSLYILPIIPIIVIIIILYPPIFREIKNLFYPKH